MELSRRKVCLLMPALLATGGRAAEAASLASKAYRFEDLRAQASGGNTFRPVFQGMTHPGCRIELHETSLAPGAMPHPPGPRRRPGDHDPWHDVTIGPGFRGVCGLQRRTRHSQRRNNPRPILRAGDRQGRLGGLDSSDSPRSKIDSS
jgi:hypothetical protein